jgi:hypothetical protein
LQRLLGKIGVATVAKKHNGEHQCRAELAGVMPLFTGVP